MILKDKKLTFTYTFPFSFQFTTSEVSIGKQHEAPSLSLKYLPE